MIDRAIKTLKKLNDRELDLFDATLKLYHTQKSKNDLSLNLIFDKYSEIHQTYAELSKYNLEALKRGLFIQWYCYTEPQYLTGIGNLKRENENMILKNLEKIIDNKKADTELLWMTTYYINNDEELFKLYHDVFDFKKYLNLGENLPKIFTNSQRGQMGKYWMSIIK